MITEHSKRQDSLPRSVGTLKSIASECYGFLTHVAVQLSHAEPKSLLWNKGILYDGRMLT